MFSEDGLVRLIFGLIQYKVRYLSGSQQLNKNGDLQFMKQLCWKASQQVCLFSFYLGGRDGEACY